MIYKADSCRRWIAAGVLVLFSGSAPVLAGPVQLLSPEQAGGLPGSPLEEPTRLLQEGQFADAEAGFLNLLATPEHAVQAMLGMAASAQARGRGDAARNWLQRALSEAPENVDLHRAEARLLIEQGDLGGAITALEGALREFPAELDVRRDLAVALAREGRVGDAIPHLRRLADDPASSAEAQAELGIALIAAGKHAEGVPLLEALASGRAPLALATSEALAHGLLQQGRAARANEVVGKALRNRQDSQRLRLLQGDALIAAGGFEQAVIAYRKALQFRPLALAELKLGHALSAAGDDAGAEQAYRRALDLDAGYVPAMNNLAMLKAGKATALDEALAWAEKAVAAGPPAAALYDTLGWVRQQRGETTLAREAYQRAVSLDPDHSAAAAHLAALGSAPVAVGPSTAAAAEATSSRIATGVVAKAPATMVAAADPRPAAQIAAERMLASHRSALQARLEHWRTAWQGKDLDAYLGAYGDAFVPADGMSLPAWKALRAKRLGKPGAIEVSVAQIEIDLRGDEATMRFEQGYRSSNYRDRSLKTLEWQRRGGDWVIVAERSKQIR
ncbi:MAG: tetratricopeptide repeat protein [Rhodocyclaceae bacterium]|nr:tetratricopeptide repeat protein [Rhodocyclaceae bacterium]